MIVVTGAAGFIGYRTVLALEKLGYGGLRGPTQSGTSKGVGSVDDLNFFSSRPEHSSKQLGAKFENRFSPDDLVKPSFFESAIQHGDPVTGVIHLGACSDTTELRLDYLNKVNVEYSKSLWNLAVQFQVPFVYASSAATYGAGEFGYEDDESTMARLRPLNPYGESKLKFDLWVLEQEKLGNVPPAWSGFKFFNVYGFGERHKGKMASVVLQGFDQLRKNKSLKLFKSHKAGIADGEQKRDFIYVEDVVEVILSAAGVFRESDPRGGEKAKPIARGIYNLGTGQARSFLDLAKATFKALDLEPKIDFIDTPLEIRDRYQYFTQATMERLQARLKEQGASKSVTSLEVGVKKTVEALAWFETEQKETR